MAKEQDGEARLVTDRMLVIVDEAHAVVDAATDALGVLRRIMCEARSAAVVTEPGWPPRRQYATLAELTESLR